MIKIGVRTHTGRERRLTLAEQLGAQGGSIWASALPGFQEHGIPSIEGLLDMRERFSKHHLALTGIGLGGEILKSQLLGLPERARDVAQVCETVRLVGRAYDDCSPADSPVIIIDQRVTYWARAGWNGSARVAGRGGVLFYDSNSRDAHLADAPAGCVPLEEVWERMAYLYERIIPVTEEAGILLATHPDDPPLPVYRGAAQALCSFAGFRQLFERFPSPNNGMLLCLGCMQEAGEDPLEVIHYFGQRKKIHYVHFRNVVGTVPHYTEVFPNMGDLDMVAALQALWQVGYDRYIVPDHQFGILDDDDWATTSRAWQLGYITGLIQATQPADL